MWHRPTLSWEFSMTFTLLSEDVMSGPNSTHPAETDQMQKKNQLLHTIFILTKKLIEKKWLGAADSISVNY